MAKEYQVLKIDEMIKPGVAGGIEKFYRHQIQTTGGVVLTVNIDEADFTEEKARPILTAAAQNADKILAG